jgi:hypothetical protein
VSEPNLLQTAHEYAGAGLSIIPIRPDGSKAPALASWAPYQTRIATAEEIGTWYGDGEWLGIATVNGAVSQNLETIDFDDLQAYKMWHRLMAEQGAAELRDRLVKIKTPRPGVQLQYRCPDGIEGNQPLARRLVDGKLKPLIETRGERGYVLSPGCPPACHATGRTYEVKRGDILNPPVISGEERALLLDTARSLNEYVEPANTHKPAPAADRNGDRPGDELNRLASWKEILEPAGWTLVFQRDGTGFWRRPGKRHGISASTDYGKAALFYNFSSSAAHFEPEHAYSKFAAYARINCRGDYQEAARELQRKGYGATRESLRAEPHEQPATAGWKLYDAGATATWPQEPLVWLVENLIPRGAIGFMSAPPKDRKSLLTLDLALHIAQEESRLWLGKFRIAPARVLFIAREDPLRRILERMQEICASYGMPLPNPGRLQFLVRERISLTDIDHREWLKTTIRQGGFEFLVLDVINRMHPDLDEISAKDMGKLVGILEELNRDLGITILSDDHTRKPQGRNTGRDNQEPNPFDMKGSIAKYGCADFMICLSRTPQANRMQVYIENKDTDERPHFFLDVSPKGSTDPKFTYAGNIEKAAADMKKVGEENRARVLAAFTSEWSSSKEVAFRLNLGGSAVSKHIAYLVMAGKLEQVGTGRATKYRLSSAQGEDTLRTNSDKGLYDND